MAQGPAERTLTELSICTKNLLASVAEQSDGHNQDVVFENSVELDKFCLVLERIFNHGFKGIQSERETESRRKEGGKEGRRSVSLTQIGWAARSSRCSPFVPCPQKVRGFFGQTRTYWEVIAPLEKFDRTASACMENVRHLSNVNTGTGKARAWLRVALIEKRVARYLRVICAQSSHMNDWYNPDAILRNPEQVRIPGCRRGGER
jgi:RUN domain